ncbi:MAG: DUF3365 domain-containing protein [Campylobacterota bacterium]|nr:DUF3365 domain-containing protein [Campylobacterota bacterium]
MNIKTKLNATLIISIFLSLFLFGFVLKTIVYDFAISSSVDKAKVITQQLLATRHYLTSIAFDVEVINKDKNPFSISPAFVGSQVNSFMLQEHNFYIKQTSFQYRNLANKPDDFETKILHRYKDKTLLNDYYTIDKYKDRDYLRYTYPLFIEKDCLQCHGKPYTDVDKATYENLVKLYGEKAFNYKLGDFRGILSVAIDIDDIEKTTDNINLNLYILLAILFIVIVVILLFDFKFIYIPQIRHIEEQVKKEHKDKQYLNIITESNNNAIIAIDETKKILTFNKKAEKIFGFSKEEMIGTQNLLNIIPLKYKNLHTVASNLYFKTGKSKGILGTTLELEGLRKDGTTFPVRISFGKNSNIDHKIVVANIEDLTQEKAKELQVQKDAKIAQDKLTKSITLFGDNVIASSCDIDGKIIYSSQALCDISGFTHEELYNQPDDFLKAPDIPTKILKELSYAIKSKEIWSGELKNRKKDGTHYWVKSSIFPDFDDNNNLIGYSSIKHDITSEKAKEEFMANMSHELRTPLNAIMGFSGILEKKLDNKKYLEFIKHINSSSKTLLSLINNILDLSKIKDAKFTIEPYEFNPYNEMVEYSKRFEGLTSQKELSFSNHISQKLQGVFYGDWIRISQIVLNIISNSIKFTPKNGSIICDADYKDGNFILNISDNGIGMNQEVQDKIFKPFEQADGSTTRKYGGTGLGLSITQSLVELMHGKINLLSNEGIGTTFTITLPLKKLDASKIEDNPITKESPTRTLNTHLLVAEDNKTNQLLIRLLLEEFHITCDIVNDGVEAIEIYDPTLHSMILMDENMPNMNGREAMRILKDRYKERCGPIITLTANNMKGDREKFLALGMDGYISKPIDEDDLFDEINRLLN